MGGVGRVGTPCGGAALGGAELVDEVRDEVLAPPVGRLNVFAGLRLVFDRRALRGGAGYVRRLL